MLLLIARCGRSVRTTSPRIPTRRSPVICPLYDGASVHAALFLPSALLLLRLEFDEVMVEAIEALVPEPAIAFEPVVHLLEGAGLDPARPPLRLPAARDETARSSTLRCLETAGRLMANGSASSVTDVSPNASRARMARRVGSARAAKVVLRRSVGIMKPLG